MSNKISEQLEHSSQYTDNNTIIIIIIITTCVIKNLQ